MGHVGDHLIKVNTSNMLTHSDYLDLVQQLKHNADAYYNSNTPNISDSEYDKLYQKAKVFEEANPLLIDPSSPTQTVEAH